MFSDRHKRLPFPVAATLEAAHPAAAPEQLCVHSLHDITKPAVAKKSFRTLVHVERDVTQIEHIRNMMQHTQVTTQADDSILGMSFQLRFCAFGL